MLKTKLPEAINTVEEAKALLTQLFENNEAYCPEDDANDLEWGTCEPTKEEKDQLNKLMMDMYNLPLIPNPLPDEVGTVFNPAEFWWDLVLAANPMFNVEEED